MKLVSSLFFFFFNPFFFVSFDLLLNFPPSDAYHFTGQAGIPESEKPFRNDPMKQARFEQFLKDKYQGGLRSSSTSAGAAAMSEEERARERLDFEATAEALSKGKTLAIPSASSLPLAAVQFTSGSREVSDSPSLGSIFPHLKLDVCSN